MAGLLEHWHRAPPSSLQKAAVGALGYHQQFYSTAFCFGARCLTAYGRTVRTLGWSSAKHKRLQLELWDNIK